mmetsp:Transcript_20406/g.51411  ORF Transcript_20406/g.51411 Transcript_20406/m.51411 type:complete len:250 (-) Transcript_20406:1404-2153(-)
MSHAILVRLDVANCTELPLASKYLKAMRQSVSTKTARPKGVEHGLGLGGARSFLTDACNSAPPPPPPPPPSSPRALMPPQALPWVLSFATMVPGDWLLGFVCSDFLRKCIEAEATGAEPRAGWAPALARRAEEAPPAAPEPPVWKALLSARAMEGAFLAGTPTALSRLAASTTVALRGVDGDAGVGAVWLVCLGISLAAVALWLSEAIKALKTSCRDARRGTTRKSWQNCRSDANSMAVPSARPPSSVQ